MKRYNYTTYSGTDGACWSIVEESDEGEYVKYNDIKHLLDRPSPWRPIAMAPKDGSVILTYEKYEDDAKIYSGWWQDDCWHTGWVKGGHRSDVDEINPTHWQPLPQPPKI